MKIYRFLMISFLLSGLSAFAAQKEFDLNAKDLKECFESENAQRHIAAVKNLSLMSASSIAQLLDVNEAAKKIVPRLEKKLVAQGDKASCFYVRKHMEYLFADKAIEKNLASGSKNSSNLFLTIGSFVTQQKKHEKQYNNVNNYIDCVIYKEDVQAEINYASSFLERMSEKIKTIEEDKQVSSMIYALALQYQKVHNIFNEHKDVLHKNIQKKDFEKRAIVNGKRVAAVGFGIFTGFVAMTAWLWSWQA